MDKENITLSGLGISAGLAMGSAFIYQDVLQRDHELYDINHDQVESERHRIKEAIEQVRKDLLSTSKRIEHEMDQDSAQIFQAQEALLKDPSLLKDLEKNLQEEMINAEQVVKVVFRRLEHRFRTKSDPVIQQRGDDVADLARRLLRVLAGIQAHTLENLSEGSVVVAKRLLPSDTVFLARHSTAGIVVEYGGPGSHAALLTREMGIPAVAAIPDPLGQINQGDSILVDGSVGRIIIRPDAQTKADFEKQMVQYHDRLAAARKDCDKPAQTTEGVQIEVLANIGNFEDAREAAANGADGVGLYRMEHMYLSRKEPPTEQELRDKIRQSLTPLRERPITIRLLDAGGDKDIPFVNLPTEANPFLGKRGARFLLEFPDLLKTQLRALLLLAKEFDLRILVPMITLAQEMKQFRQMLDEQARSLQIVKTPPLGAMIETPAAALCVADIAEHADFLSLGTNDLTQYTMAAGRENASVNEYFMDDHPALLRLIYMVVEEAGNVPLSICGELAARTEAIPKLLQAGIRSLSVAPLAIPIIKETIRRTSL